ncbi:hypothetical protein LV779_39210 [Streptomyces thinghirensis]|nr:hypothetical protein [Streptomyces thinghirensis]
MLAEHVDSAEEFRRLLLRRVHRTVLDALEHSAYPLITLADDLRPRGTPRPAPPSTSPSSLYFQNWTRTARRDAAGDAVWCSARSKECTRGRVRPGPWRSSSRNRAAATSLKYDPGLLRRGDCVARLGARLHHPLAAAVEAPRTPVADLELLTERAGPALPPAPADYPADTSIWELVRRQADARPDAVAVRHAGTELT